MGYFDEKPHGCPFVITIADGHVTDVAVLPPDNKDLSPHLIRLCVFLSATQQSILPDCSHPHQEYTVAPLGWWRYISLSVIVVALVRDGLCHFITIYVESCGACSMK